MQDRSVRRHHLQRMKARAAKIGKRQGWIRSKILCAEHMASCSCWMCGNPRKYFGEPTIQEIKSDEAFKAAMKDLLEEQADAA